jgi:hypothetical protein
MIPLFNKALPLFHPSLGHWEGQAIRKTWSNTPSLFTIHQAFIALAWAMDASGASIGASEVEWQLLSRWANLDLTFGFDNCPLVAPLSSPFLSHLCFIC